MTGSRGDAGQGCWSFGELRQTDVSHCTSSRGICNSDMRQVNVIMKMTYLAIRWLFYHVLQPKYNWALLRASLRSLRTTSMPPLAHFLALDIQIFLGRQAGGHATMTTSCHNCLPQQHLPSHPGSWMSTFLVISTVTPHYVPKPHNFKLCTPLDMDTWTSPLHVL